MSEKDFGLFWSTYPSDLCNRKGSRKVAEQKWDKLDAEVQQQILVNLRELMRVDRKLKKMGEFVAKWPMVSTWLNQERWQDIVDIRQSEDMPVECSKCACGQPTNIGRLCWTCYEKLNPTDFTLQKAALRNAGLTKREGETRQEWNLRCKEYCLPKGGLGRLIGSGKSRSKADL